MMLNAAELKTDDIAAADVEVEVEVGWVVCVVPHTLYPPRYQSSLVDAVD